MKETFSKGDMDFRGLHLCDSCWNGNHFVKGETGGLINNCGFGNCQCPCSTMQRNRAEQLFARKQQWAENKQKQQVIPDVGAIEIK